MTEAKDI